MFIDLYAINISLFKNRSHFYRKIILNYNSPNYTYTRDTTLLNSASTDLKMLEQVLLILIFHKINIFNFI